MWGCLVEEGGGRGVCFEERRGLAGVVGWSVVIF